MKGLQGVAAGLRANAAMLHRLCVTLALLGADAGGHGAGLQLGVEDRAIALIVTHQLVGGRLTALGAGQTAAYALAHRLDLILGQAGVGAEHAELRAHPHLIEGGGQKIGLQRWGQGVSFDHLT